MSLKQLFFICFVAGLLASCSVQQRTTASSNKRPSTSSSTAAKYTIKGPSNAVAYVEKYKHIAVSESVRTGIPASIKLAQGILESGYGSSQLAQKANNHFGIKCGGNWKGKTMRYKGSCYRVFKSGADAYKEHSNFLVNGSRYDFLFKFKRNDYKAWAKGLKKAGYATNPQYPSKVIELIERYKLYYYDK